jgi:hypothetical protein
MFFGSTKGRKADNQTSLFFAQQAKNGGSTGAKAQFFSIRIGTTGSRALTQSPNMTKLLEGEVRRFTGCGKSLRASSLRD